jgi:hypothetical protein
MRTKLGAHVLAVLLLGVCTTLRSESNPQVEGAPGSVNLPAGTAFTAKLTTNLDPRQSKPGEAIEAEATQDLKQGHDVLLKKGSRLLGQVQEVQTPSAEKPETTLKIVFDNARLKNGPTQSLHLIIQAMVPEAETPSSSTLSEGRGLPGATTAATVPGHVDAGGTVSPLSTATVGVYGFPGTRLAIQKTSNGQVTLLILSNPSILFKKGTRLVLQVVSQ